MVTGHPVDEKRGNMAVWLKDRRESCLRGIRNDVADAFPVAGFRCDPDSASAYLVAAHADLSMLNSSLLGQFMASPSAAIQGRNDT